MFMPGWKPVLTSGFGESCSARLYLLPRCGVLAWCHTDKERFIDEVTRQLGIIFDAIRERHKPPEVLEHRCAGFMRAGVFPGVVKTPELSTLMEDLQLDMVAMTIDERMARRRDRYGGLHQLQPV